MPLTTSDAQGNRWAARFPAAGGFLLILCVLLGSGCSTVPDGAPPPQNPEVADRTSTPKPSAPRPLDGWRQLIREKQYSPIDEKLSAVNAFFNRLEFVDDLTHWGQADYWATPEEMLLSNGGDCEDFSIAKYFTLRQMQVPEETLRLTYVRSLTRDQPHMVLCYYPHPQAEPLVLDNLQKHVLPASRRPDLAPVYCFNVEGLWLAQQQGLGIRVGDAQRLSLWQALLARMEEARLAELLVRVDDVALEPCALGIGCARE